MWSHYADRHRGLCLGFDVADDSVREVEYTNERKKLPDNASENDISSLLFLKFEGWSYEQEWRSWVTLDKKVDGHYFYDFGEQMTLKEVFVGSFSDVSRSDVTSALSKGNQKAFVVKKRLAFKTFTVVENRKYRDMDEWAQ